MAPLWEAVLRTTFALMCPDRPLGLSEQVCPGLHTLTVTLLHRAPASAVTGGQRPPSGRV